MQQNDRIKRFLQLQKKGIKLEDIAKELGIASTTLRATLNKNGYKSDKSIYKLRDEKTKSSDIIQLQLTDIDKVKNKPTKKSNSKVSKPQKLKKDRKINLTEDDLDKLCEVYDWYLQVKDCKSIRPKKTTPKKDIILDTLESSEVKMASIRINKQIWQEFERLCANSSFTKQEIITQALKDFMKEYKDLL